MIIAYNLIDIVIRSRKRSNTTSTSASIIKFIFGNLLIKDLSISIVINAYNHYMGGVDTANRYRANFTTL